MIEKLCRQDETDTHSSVSGGYPFRPADKVPQSSDINVQ